MSILALALKLGALLFVAFWVVRAVERFTSRLFLHLEQFGKTGDPANIAASKLELEKKRLDLETELARARRTREELVQDQAVQSFAQTRDPYDG